MEKYTHNSIMQNQMLPFVDENMSVQWMFPQDNYPKHTSKLIKSWFDTNKITAMLWPAQYHDLNPIENLWKQLVDKLCLHCRFRNAEEFYQELQIARSKIKEFKLIESMPHNMYQCY